jgi:hypothetical protein
VSEAQPRPPNTGFDTINDVLHRPSRWYQAAPLKEAEADEETLNIQRPTSNKAFQTMKITKTNYKFQITLNFQ